MLFEIWRMRDFVSLVLRRLLTQFQSFIDFLLRLARLRWYWHADRITWFRFTHACAVTAKPRHALFSIPSATKRFSAFVIVAAHAWTRSSWSHHAHSTTPCKMLLPRMFIFWEWYFAFIYYWKWYYFLTLPRHACRNFILHFLSEIISIYIESNFLRITLHYLEARHDDYIRLIQYFARCLIFTARLRVMISH